MQLAQYVHTNRRSRCTTIIAYYYRLPSTYGPYAKFSLSFLRSQRMLRKTAEFEVVWFLAFDM